ncbi:MAG: hypothetical protein ABI041_16620 [Bdellovibrionia bacterium]
MLTFSFVKRSWILGLLFLTTTFVNWNAFGEIEHTKLKGLSQFIRPEFQYLSPIAGFTLLKRGTLENLYRYGNEEDQNVRLVRSMFYSVDVVNFGPTTLPSNVCAHLTSAGIGALLNQLVSPRDELEKRLLQVIYKELELNSVAPGSSKYTKKERQLLRKSSKEFVATLMGAIQETITEEPKYPAHFPEHILLGLFWSKAKNDKNEFLNLFRQMPQILKDEKILTENQTEWLDSHYTLEDYSEKMKTLLAQNPDLRGASLAGDLELSTFLAHSYDIWENFLPPIVNYERTYLMLESGLEKKPREILLNRVVGSR